MHNAEFTNLTQTIIFHIQDLFQWIFLTSIQPQITQEHIKSHQKMNCLVFVVSEMMKRELDNYFCSGSLNHRAISNWPGQPEPDFHYIQRFYKSHPKITLLNKKTHKIFDSHKNLDTYPTRIAFPDLKSHQTNQLEAQEHPNVMVVVPSQPYMCSSSYSQVKMPPRSPKIFKPRVAIVYCRERVFQRRMTKFRAQKLIFAPLLSKIQHI